MKMFWVHWYTEFLEQSNSEEKEVEWRVSVPEGKRKGEFLLNKYIFFNLKW